MSRTAAGPGVGRWRGMGVVEYVKRDDTRWFWLQPPRRQRRQCVACVFNQRPVRMKVWHESKRFSWRCPSCGVLVPIDQARFAAWQATVT